MKWLIALLMALLLTGCTGQPAETTQPVETTNPTVTTTAPAETTQPTAPAQTEPTEPGLYIPDSPLEKQTSGAIRAYDLGGMSVIELRTMGSELLLVGDTSMDTEFMLLSGKNCVVRSYMNAGAYLFPTDGCLQISGEQIAYYDSGDNSVVLLTAALKESARVALPEGIMGSPAISQDMGTVYYCVEGNIRALDLHTGVSRLLRQQECKWMTIYGEILDASVLHVYMNDTDGSFSHCFISTLTGELIGRDEQLTDIGTDSDGYILARSEGHFLEVLFGTPGQEPSCFRQSLRSAVYPAPASGAVCCVVDGEGSKTLSWYDLTTGLRTACVNLPASLNVYQILGDPAGNCVWIAAFDSDTEASLLLRWDLSASYIPDSTVYTSRRYTAEQPDTQGLAQLQAQADQIGREFGVKIIVDGNVTQPEDYVLTPEHRTDTLAYALQALKDALSVYPEGFLRRAAEVTESGVVEISLVRDISGNVDGVQYWLDREGYVAIEITDHVDGTFYHELSHILDSTIIPNSYAYDDWEDLNPKGVYYHYNYSDYAYCDEDDCFVNGQRVFVDTYSMTFPKEDRARILEYAMQPDNAYLFESDTMQRKLLQICEGIRECFGLEKSRETFLWEQYLNVSLAYTK